MPSVPSHDRSFFQEAIDRAGIPAHRSAPSSASIPLNSLSSFTRRSIPFVLSTSPSTHRPDRMVQFICSRGAPARPDHPCAQQGGWYDILSKIAAGHDLAGIRIGLRDCVVAQSRTA